METGQLFQAAPEIYCLNMTAILIYGIVRESLLAVVAPNFCKQSIIVVMH